MPQPQSCFDRSVTKNSFVLSGSRLLNSESKRCLPSYSYGTAKGWFTPSDLPAPLFGLHSKPSHYQCGYTPATAPFQKKMWTSLPLSSLSILSPAWFTTGLYKFSSIFSFSTSHQERWASPSQTWSAAAPSKTMMRIQQNQNLCQNFQYFCKYIQKNISAIEQLSSFPSKTRYPVTLATFILSHCSQLQDFGLVKEPKTLGKSRNNDNQAAKSAHMSQ